MVNAQGDAVSEQGQQMDPQAGGASQIDKDEAEKAAALALAKEERKRAAKQKKRTMESCLTLVRAFYHGQDAQV